MILVLVYPLTTVLFMTYTDVPTLFIMFKVQVHKNVTIKLMII